MSIDDLIAFVDGGVVIPTFFLSEDDEITLISEFQHLDYEVAVEKWQQLIKIVGFDLLHKILQILYKKNRIKSNNNRLYGKLLYEAVIYDRTGLVEQALAAGYNPNYVRSHRTSTLSKAIELGFHQHIALLLQARTIDVNAKPAHGHTALYTAICKKNDIATAIKLVESEDFLLVDSRDDTFEILEAAIKLGHHVLLRKLVILCRYKIFSDQQLHNLLLALAHNNPLDSIPHLVNSIENTSSAIVNKKSKPLGMTIIHWAICLARVDALNYFSQRPDIDINQCSANGTNALEYAVLTRVTESADVLLNCDRYTETSVELGSSSVSASETYRPHDAKNMFLYERIAKEILIYLAQLKEVTFVDNPALNNLCRQVISGGYGISGQEMLGIAAFIRRKLTSLLRVEPHISESDYLELYLLAVDAGKLDIAESLLSKFDSNVLANYRTEWSERNSGFAVDASHRLIVNKKLLDDNMPIIEIDLRKLFSNFINEIYIKLSLLEIDVSDEKCTIGRDFMAVEIRNFKGIIYEIITVYYRINNIERITEIVSLLIHLRNAVPKAAVSIIEKLLNEIVGEYKLTSVLGERLPDELEQYITSFLFGDVMIDDPWKRLSIVSYEDSLSDADSSNHADLSCAAENFIVEDASQLHNTVTE